MEFINPIFEFSRAMNELQLNDAEFALLIAISIFSAGAEEAQEGKPERDSNQRGLQVPIGQGSWGWRPSLCSWGMAEVGWGRSLFLGL